MASNIENNELAKAYKGKDLAPDLNIQVRNLFFEFNLTPTHVQSLSIIVEFHALQSDNC